MVNVGNDCYISYFHNFSERGRPPERFRSERAGKGTLNQREGKANKGLYYYEVNGRFYRLDTSYIALWYH